MSRLYPEPPHLSVSLYDERGSERELFAALAGVLRQLGGTPTGEVDVVAAHARFDGLTDLPADDIACLSVPAAEFDRLVGGAEPSRTAVRAGFRTDKAGLAVLSYLRRTGDDRHPIDISVHADALGMPPEVWEKNDAAAARRLAAWARGLAQAACEQTAPLYAELTVETTLPTPAALIGAELRDVFIADRLLAADPGLEPALRKCYREGDVARWDGGLYCSTWAPFNDAGRTMPYDADLGWQVARLIDAAIGRLGS